MSSIFNISLFDKEEDITSFSSLSSFKKKYRGEKVGHAGTLDKFASGLMIVMVGGATKLNPIFSSFDKSYRASLQFGFETDTLDREGNVIYSSDNIPTKEEILNVLPSFIGKIKQIPPLYSAIHVNGKRAYTEARKNRPIDIPEREVEIKSLDLVSYNDGLLVFDTLVSKGTYIRSLGRDIALKLNSRGSLVNLRRRSIGPYTLSDIGLSTTELLDKSGLFSLYSISSEHKKEVDNGTLKPQWLEKMDHYNRKYGILFISNSLYGYIEIGEKVKVLSRV